MAKTQSDLGSPNTWGCGLLVTLAVVVPTILTIFCTVKGLVSW